MGYLYGPELERSATLKRIITYIVPFLICLLLAFPSWAGSTQGCIIRTMQGCSAVVFDPLSLSPIAWYDATDASGVILNGADVSQWNDLSGNGNHLVQATGSRQPLFVASGIGGQPTVRFLGAEFIGPVTLSTAITQPFTIVHVGKHNLKGSFTTPYNGSGTGTTQLFYDGGGNGRLFHGSQQNLVVKADGVVRIFSDIADTTDLFRLNGVLDTSVNAGSEGFSNFKIGADGGSGARLDGDIPELFIFTKALTTSEHNQLGNYLADKYGLTWTDIP